MDILLAQIQRVKFPNLWRLTMKKRIELMADYGCYPLWWKNGDGNIDPATLPLSPETLKRLEEWTDIYDRLLNQDDPAASGFPDDRSRDAFDKRGIALWHQLLAELPPEDYEVGYFSERLGEHLSHPSELEVKIAVAK